MHIFLPIFATALSSYIATVATEESPWILQQYDVCFGAIGKSFGKFRLNQNGALYALKLVHRSGYVNCASSAVKYRSNFGCNAPAELYYNSKMVGVVVTENTDEIIFPKSASYVHGFYKLPGYNSMSDELAFVDFTTPMYGRNGQEIRIWYREDLIDYGQTDNGGRACVDVYAKFA